MPLREGTGSHQREKPTFDFLKAFAFPTHHMLPPYDELMALTVGEVMTEAVVQVEPAAPLTRALQLMVEPEGAQLSRCRSGWAPGGNHRTRGYHAGAQRGDYSGRLTREHDSGGLPTSSSRPYPYRR
jgi:hypothetical protein